jgi:hypothetical protein
MSRQFLRFIALAALVAAFAGCGGSSETTRAEYVEECSVGAGREHCECVWEWFERDDSRREDPDALVRADDACLAEKDNEYIDACAAAGRTRSFCRCVWRWFTRNVPRERAKVLAAERRRNPGFQSRELRGAARACS